MLFSVVIPAYNAEKFIHRSIGSVLGQTFDDFEVVVVNDGSRDATWERIGEITDPRVHAVSQENGGVSVARNTGIMHAKGDYVCFLDADDEYLPDHLKIFATLIERYPTRGFFASNFCVSDIDDAEKVTMPECTGEVFVYENVVEQILIQSELICTGCVCIRRELFEKYGMFVPGVKLGEDTDMWRRVYVHTGLVFSDRATFKCNRDGSAATRSYSRRFEVDPLGRLPQFLADPEISDAVKESLKTEHEMVKTQVVRSYLFVGDRKSARELMRTVDRTRIPKRRWQITRLCFWIPSFVIRAALKFKNRGLYR